MFYVFHDQVCHSNRHWGAHCCAVNLPVEHAFVGKICGIEAKTEQRADFMWGKCSAISKGVIELKTITSNLDGHINQDTSE